MQVSEFIYFLFFMKKICKQKYLRLLKKSCRFSIETIVVARAETKQKNKSHSITVREKQKIYYLNAIIYTCFSLKTPIKSVSCFFSEQTPIIRLIIFKKQSDELIFFLSELLFCAENNKTTENRLNF